MAVYSATKAFVTSFSEAIAEENRPYGIQVLALCPGSTKTNFFVASNIERPVQVKGQQTAEQVVETAMRGVRGGRTKVVSGLTNFVGAIIGKHVPNMITTRAIARALRSKYQKQ
jgi:short-subunit dehydrogenase